MLSGRGHRAHFLKQHTKAFNPAYSFTVSVKDRNAYTEFLIADFFPWVQCIFKLQKHLHAPEA